MFDFLILDINWTYADGKYTQILKVLNLKTDEVLKIPLENYQLQFNLSQEKFCIGYHGIDGWVACPKKAKLDGPTRTQCFYCEKEEGFKSAFLFNQTPNENARFHLSQPFYVYLAFFAPDVIKVGTAAEKRKFIRPIEQDALYYTYIAKAPDGFVVQNLEHAISSTLNMTEFVRSVHKLKFISERPKQNLAADFLTQNFRKVLHKFETNTTYLDWFSHIENLLITDLTGFLFFPEEELILLKNEFNLSGKFLGLRGRYFLFENNNNMFAVDKKWLIGRQYSWSDKPYVYTVSQKEQLGLF